MFTTKEIGIFRDFVHQSFGIHIPKEKGYLIESKLRKALTKTGRQSVDDLISKLDEATLRLIVQSVTTNHTFFFREAGHFEILVKDLINRNVRNPTIWCAASSSGEEPYSIVMSCLEAKISRFFILASDVDREMLQIMNTGRYRENRVRQVPPAFLTKYFHSDGIEKDERCYKVKSELRNHLAIRELNLLRAHRLTKEADAIFLRNVLIYFDRETQAEVTEKVCRNLAPGGLLFVGHSESLAALPIASKLIQVESAVYRLKEGQHK